MVRPRVILLHPPDNFIYGVDGRLPEGVNCGSWNIAEVDRPAKAVDDILRLVEPLIGFQQRPVV